MKIPLLLIIEDCAVDTELLRNILVQAYGDSVRLVFATSYEDARREIMRDCPNLMVVDLNLPDSSGYQTVVKLQELAPGIPIVVYTGEDRIQERDKCRMAGAASVLLKADKGIQHSLINEITMALERVRDRICARCDIQERMSRIEHFLTEFTGTLKDQLKKHDYALFGNGEVGLVAWQRDADRTLGLLRKFGWTLVGSFTAIIVGLLAVIGTMIAVLVK